VAEVGAVLVDDIAAAVAPVGDTLELKAVEVDELLHGVGGLCHDLGLEGGLCRCRRRRDDVLDGLFDLGRGGGLLRSLCRGHLLLSRGLCLVAERRALLALRGVTDRARLRGRAGGLLRLTCELHLRLLGRRPAGESVEDVSVGPLVIGLLLLEERAELLADGRGRLVVRVRLLDEGADALRELDPHIGLLWLRVGVLHLLRLRALCGCNDDALDAEGGLKGGQLRLERGDGAKERLGGDDGRAHFDCWITVC